MQARQATSLRVDQRLYERLSRLARDRGTSITRQLEMAIQHHLEATVTEDHLPVLKPALERVITENLEATVSAKIEEVKQRLAGLLAKTAMDTAALYLLETRRLGEEEKAVRRACPGTAHRTPRRRSRRRRDREAQEEGRAARQGPTREGA